MATNPVQSQALVNIMKENWERGASWEKCLPAEVHSSHNTTHTAIT